MKFHELTAPDCSHCDAKALTYWSARCDAEHNVLSVSCGPCTEAADLARWDADKRLRSSLTLTAALKAQSRRVVVQCEGGFIPPHPWEAPIAFDERKTWTAATLYTPRDPDFRGPVMLSLWTRTTAEMRQFPGGREFDLYGDGRPVARGAVVPWDMRWLDIAEASERVHATVKATLEPLVWFGGLASIVRPAKLRGLKGAADTAVGRVEMVTYSSAGRCLIQLDTPTDRVTCITAEDEDEPRMGVQGIDATADAAVSLLCAASAAWREGAFEMVESADVGM